MTSQDHLIDVCHQPIKYGGLSYRRSGYIMLLICHVTSLDHMFNGLCEFMGGSLSG